MFVLSFEFRSSGDWLEGNRTESKLEIIHDNHYEETAVTNDEIQENKDETSTENQDNLDAEFDEPIKTAPNISHKTSTENIDINDEEVGEVKKGSIKNFEQHIINLNRQRTRNKKENHITQYSNENTIVNKDDIIPISQGAGIENGVDYANSDDGYDDEEDSNGDHEDKEYSKSDEDSSEEKEDKRMKPRPAVSGGHIRKTFYQAHIFPKHMLEELKVGWLTFNLTSQRTEASPVTL